MSESDLSDMEEFVASLKYMFFLFKRQFTPILEQATRAQWQRLHTGDATIREDGQNNPLVDIKVDEAFYSAIYSALLDSNGKLPSLTIPKTEEQVGFWRSKATGSMRPGSLDELSETTSHLETIGEALAWFAASATASGRVDGAPGHPIRVCILGASARYEYAVGINSAEELTECLAKASEAAAPGQHAEFVLCGRDVPEDLHGKSIVSRSGLVVTRHHIGYLHDLPMEERTLSGALFIALHSGMGLEHPELTKSWPPTFRRLRSAAPAWIAVSSFNPVEHEAAERALRVGCLTHLSVEASGVNRAGSLCGPDVVDPLAFDGVQGKRNYCVLHARILAPATRQDDGEGWDLFD